MIRSAQPTAQSAVEYPTGDGRPMAETPQHGKNLSDSIFTLNLWYETDPNVYVSGNMMMYYEARNRRKHFSADVFVAKGVAKNKERRCYLIWEEKVPDVAIEFTSKSTRREDLGTKFQLYEKRLGIPEYFLFDPFAEYLTPRMQGYRLQAGVYVPIELLEGRLPSAVLGLHLEPKDDQLRYYDPVSSNWLPTPEEMKVSARQQEARADTAEARADTAEARARQAEDENMRLREQLLALQPRRDKDASS